MGLAAAGLIVGGCDFIYDFEYGPIGGAGGAGSGSSSSGSTSTSSGTSSSGSSGAGGSCVPAEPTCGIELVATSAGKATKPFGDITVSDQAIYWIAAQSVLRLPKGTVGVAPEPSLAAIGAAFIAGNVEDKIYVGAFEFIYSVSAVPEVVPLMNGPSPTGVTGLAVSSGSIYWPSALDNKIYKSDGMNAPVLLDALGGASNVVLDMIAGSDADPTVYWLYRSVNGMAGGIRAYAAANDPDFQTLPSEEPVALAVDGDATTGSVFWLTYNGVAHGRKKAMGSPIHDSKAAQSASQYAKFKTGRIVVGGSYVYWLGATGETCLSNKVCACGEECGAIMVAPKDTLDPPAVFASGPWASLRGLAVDNEYVYWTAATEADDVLLRKAVLP